MRQTITLLAAVVVSAVAVRADEKSAVQAAIDSYVRAFNDGNPAALAAHWTDDGEFVMPGGEKVQGHDQLEESFTAYFAEAKQAQLELADTTIEFLSPGVAIESGIARVVVPEQQPEETTYKAIHVKTADGWKIDSVTEENVSPPPPSNYEHLQALEWMVGEWTNADHASAIQLSCRWTTNQNFLVRSFSVVIEGQVDFAGTQVIGWDPSVQTIRSWLFDSDGGFGVGRWTGDSQSWTVRTLNVLPDGRRGSSTNIYEIVDADTVRFRSVGRQVDSELLPNVEPVTIVRVNEQ